MLSMKADANRKHTKLDNLAFIFLYSYFLTLSISQLVSFIISKKQFSLTREVNLKIKEFHSEKAGFRAIHTENDADMLISWRRKLMTQQNFRRISAIS